MEHRLRHWSPNEKLDDRHRHRWTTTKKKTKKRTEKRSRTRNVNSAIHSFVHLFPNSSLSTVDLKSFRCVVRFGVCSRGFCYRTVPDTKHSTQYHSTHISVHSHRFPSIWFRWMSLLFVLAPSSSPPLLLFGSLIIIYSIIMFSIIAKVVHFIVLVSFVFLFQLFDGPIHNMCICVYVMECIHFTMWTLFIRSHCYFSNLFAFAFAFQPKNLNLLLLLNVIVFCAFEWFETWSKSCNTKHCHFPASKCIECAHPPTRQPPPPKNTHK